MRMTLLGDAFGSISSSGTNTFLSLYFSWFVCFLCAFLICCLSLSGSLKCMASSRSDVCFLKGFSSFLTSLPIVYFFRKAAFSDFGSREPINLFRSSWGIFLISCFLDEVCSSSLFDEVFSSYFLDEAYSSCFFDEVFSSCFLVELFSSCFLSVVFASYFLLELPC